MWNQSEKGTIMAPPLSTHMSLDDYHVEMGTTKLNDGKLNKLKTFTQTCTHTYIFIHTHKHIDIHTNERLSQCISIEHVLCYRRTVFNLTLIITFPIERRYMTIPSDHQSTDMLYGCPDSISGAAIETSTLRKQQSVT